MAGGLTTSRRSAVHTRRHGIISPVRTRFRGKVRLRVSFSGRIRTDERGRVLRNPLGDERYWNQKRDFGHDPQTTLEVGVPLTIEWMKKVYQEETEGISPRELPVRAAAGAL